ncbi:hypothetical protein DDQ68_08275 [Hymenobacter nivis]|uniref:Uncharacterized protein n=2 Tax=Hymenobacter nivis TaxID=1850093 RepID=A0A2Z3GP77_9BACT|nr:hypothetical protein DDQ68_08275 [Hymenobacter nivis]
MMGSFITKDGSWGYAPFTQAQFVFAYLLSVLLVLGCAYCVRKGYLWAKLLEVGLFLFITLSIASNFKTMSILNIHSFWEGVTAISQLVLNTMGVVFIIISLKIQTEVTTRVVK